MLKRLILLVVALGVVFGGIFAWKYRQMMQQMEAASQPPAPATVSAGDVTQEQWQDRLSAVGSLTAVKGIDVTNELGGLVTAIHFESGTRVEEGERLISLDTSVDRAELAELRARRDLAQAEFERTQKLFKNGNASRSALDAARAELRTVESRIAAQEARIAKKTIRAPFAGKLGLRQVDEGDYLAPGSPIVPLQSLSPIYADFSLPEQRFPQIAEGLTVEVVARAYPERRFTGRIAATDPGADPGNRKFRVRAVLDNADRALRPGMFAEIRVVLPTERMVMTIPGTAVTYNPYGESVFALVKNEAGELVAQSKQIRTGEVRAGRVEILKGLTPGETVVTAGQLKLRNGQRVTVDNSVELSPETVDLNPEVQFSQ